MSEALDDDLASSLPGRPLAGRERPARVSAPVQRPGPDTLATIAFVGQARRLGFRLDEIKDVVQIRRFGHCPCPHVLDLVRQKVGALDRTLAELTERRTG